MNVVIIDDDEKSTQELKGLLGKYGDVNVCSTAANSFDGLAIVGKLRPNVIFLDVMMPIHTGLDLLDRMSWVKDDDCRIVMYTAHSEYILPSIRKGAFDVLLKPVDPRELDIVISRLRSSLLKGKPEISKSKVASDKILLWINVVDFKLFNKSDIGVIQHDSEHRCWEALVANYDKPLRMKRSVKAVDLANLDSHFVQVNQKYIINISYLIEVVDNRCQFYPPFDKIDYVTVGRYYRKKLTDMFFSL